MFLESCRWKRKETSTRDILSYQRRISTMDVFVILQFSANDFRVKTKGGKQKHYKKLKQIRYFNVINIAECCCKIGCTLCTSEGSVINQSWSTQFPVATFPQKALFDSWITWYASTTCEKVLHMQMPMFLPLRYSTRVRFILGSAFSVDEIAPKGDSAKCQLLRLYSQFSWTKILNAGLNIYSILEERPKALLKMFLIDVDRPTLPRRPQDVIFEQIF